MVEAEQRGLHFLWVCLQRKVDEICVDDDTSELEQCPVVVIAQVSHIVQSFGRSELLSQIGVILVQIYQTLRVFETASDCPLVCLPLISLLHTAFM